MMASVVVLRFVSVKFHLSLTLAPILTADGIFFEEASRNREPLLKFEIHRIGLGKSSGKSMLLKSEFSEEYSVAGFERCRF